MSQFPNEPSDMTLTELHVQKKSAFGESIANIDPLIKPINNTDLRLLTVELLTASLRPITTNIKNQASKTKISIATQPKFNGFISVLKTLT